MARSHVCERNVDVAQRRDLDGGGEVLSAKGQRVERRAQSIYGRLDAAFAFGPMYESMR